MGASIMTFLRSLPLAIGVLLTLVSFSLLIESGASDFGSDAFVGFVICGLLGIPLIFVGLSLVSRKPAEQAPRHTSSDDTGAS